MKLRFLAIFFALFWVFSLPGCAAEGGKADIAATTLPVYDFTARLCQNTGLTVSRLVTENVSCLHDYTLSVHQVRTLQSANTVVISGAGLEDFMADLLPGKNTIDSSAGIALLESCHHHDHEGHSHNADGHIWLSPKNAGQMAQNICDGLCRTYPLHADTFRENLAELLADIATVQAYGDQALGNLSCRELITFHDGFAYLADAFGLTILEAIEEESGSEASAGELKELITLVRSHNLPAIFTERNGSTSAAGVISTETGAAIYTLDMAMSGDSWLEAMYHNIDTLKEALE